MKDITFKNKYIDTNNRHSNGKESNIKEIIIDIGSGNIKAYGINFSKEIKSIYIKI